MPLVITLNNSAGILDSIEVKDGEGAKALALKLSVDWTDLMPGDVIIVSETE